MTGTSDLAYVFWHRPTRMATDRSYESDLLTFHDALRTGPPVGFVGSVTFGVDGASWLPAGRAGFEDWYLVRDWAALGTLNDGAVAAERKPHHDRVAGRAQSGIGAMYARHTGDGPPAAEAVWFDKPAGWSYARLNDVLGPLPGDDLTLWRRQLVLGPAPEFCLRAQSAPALPPAVRGERISYRLLR